MKQLRGAEFEYFSCRQSPALVSGFYREQLKKPPYSLSEVNWVVRSEGTLGVYYNYISRKWTYLWVIKGLDGRGSRVVMARSGLDLNCDWKFIPSPNLHIGFGA
jgi:hypothetical protein